MHLIGLDIGTTGCKAIVFTPDGRPLGRGFREYGVSCPEPGTAEQDAELVWSLALEALTEAVGRSGVRDFRALSISVQGDAITMVDSAMRAAHPMILGMDYRSREQAAACDKKFGAFDLFQHTGMRSHPMNSLNKALFLRERRPDLFEGRHRLVTYADFILGKLGAEPVIDYTMASRTMAFDLLTKTWSNHLLAALDLPASLFSRPVASGTKVGELSAAVAAATGLPRGLTLVAGGHDQACAAIGAGAVREGIGVSSMGTAEVFSAALRKPALSKLMFDSFYPCYLHAVPDMSFTFALVHVGGIVLRWYRDNLGHAEVADAQTRSCDPYALIDERMPAGPSPLLVLPHFNGSGTPTCDLDSRGAILGLSLSSTRHDIAKAILEGLCFELRLNLGTLQTCGVNIDEVVAVGGGSRSPLWLQLKADIFGRPVRTLRCSDAACLGAALLAGVGSGVYASLTEAAAATVRIERVFEPAPARAAAYAERFALYESLHATLKPIHARI